MNRITEERLEEIRKIRQTNRETCHWGHVADLLDEIDALRSESKVISDTSYDLGASDLDKISEEMNGYRNALIEILNQHIPNRASFGLHRAIHEAKQLFNDGELKK